MTLAATRTVDPYPTRIADAPELIDRTEPTVWTTGMAGPIDPATLAGHDTRGFSVHHDLLSPAEVDAYREELRTLAADTDLRSDERAVHSDTDGLSTIYEAHRVSELIGELAADPRVLDRARQVLGSQVYLHQSRVDYLPGFHGKGAYWHSDFETWHAEDGMPAPRAVTMSIALTQQYPADGGRLVMPGSHRTFVPCEDDQPSRDHLTSLAAAYGIQQCTAGPGSVLMVDANLMHGSSENITPFPRADINLVFNSVENTLVAPFAGTAPRPDHIASRTVEPLRH
jgi:ectoine hydroxylase